MAPSVTDLCVLVTRKAAWMRAILTQADRLPVLLVAAFGRWLASSVGDSRADSHSNMVCTPMSTR